MESKQATYNNNNNTGNGLLQVGLLLYNILVQLGTDTLLFTILDEQPC